MAALMLGLGVGLVVASGVLIGAGLVLTLGRARRDAVPIFVAFAAGTLLTTALLGLLPESGERLSLTAAAGLMLLAIVGFFLLEKWVLWRHAHYPEGEGYRAAGYLILAGDSAHNAVDGLAIGVAFTADPWLGVLVGLAALAHEIPQEVGDFVLLLESGLSRARALAYNLLSAAAVFPGVVAGQVLGEAVEQAQAVVLALAAGGFLYVALADLVPLLHRRERGWRLSLVHQVLPLLAGAAVIWHVGRLEA